MQTTLKALRKAKACVPGYNRLVCAIKGVEYEERESYMHFRYDEPIALTYILNSNGLDDALWALRASDCSNRDARLFAVWCVRQLNLTDPVIVNTIEVCERYANGQATDYELSAARSAVWLAAWLAAESAARSAAWSAAWSAARSAAESAAESAQSEMFIKMCRGEAPWQQEV